MYNEEIQEKKKDLQIQTQTIQKMAIGTYISITTLNVIEFNVPNKRHKLADLKTRPIYMLSKRKLLET